MSDQALHKIDIPTPAKVVALVLIIAVFYGGANGLLVESKTPLLLPLITAGVSAACLWLVRSRRHPLATCMRVGFHVGMFAYFLSYPILSPDTLDGSISPATHQLVGLALLFTVVGFEAAYWIKSSGKQSFQDSMTPLVLSIRQRNWLVVAVCLGLSARSLSVWDYAESAGVSPIDVLLTMRGQVEGAPAQIVTKFGYLSYILDAGVFLAATAALLLLVAGKRPSMLVACMCWLALVLCALTGFLVGSRAVFLYSFSPLVAASWIKLSRLHVGRSSRWLSLGIAGVLVIAAWSAMSAMRGDDIRKYEGSWEDISPQDYAQGAFDIYSATAMVVEGFPKQIPYESGKSLVPLVLGWVPRTLWPDKPYPFSLHANTLRGESLEFRAASIAVGLSGEGYGNFGLAGALFWGALMGLACRWGDDRVGRLSESNPLRLQLGAMGGIWAAMIVRGGVPEMFYMGLSVIMYPVLLSWLLSHKRKGIRHRKEIYPPIDTNGLSSADASS